MGKVLLYLFTLNLINIFLLIVFAIHLALSGTSLINLGNFLGYSAVVIVIFLFLFFIKLYHVCVRRRPPQSFDLGDKKVVVGMTALDDEEAIGPAVKDFLSHPRVSEVIVVDNASKDQTAKIAAQAGATVVIESIRGYGSACIRALKEISKKGDILVLVEGDQTFKAKDLDKMLPYLENVEMVQGTRTTRELSSPDSQLNFLMNLGNQFVAKLMQIRFLGYRFTDVGCTYRIIRKDAYMKLKEHLTVKREYFLAQLMVEALKRNLSIIEIPITFWKRAGRSKGVGGNIFKGLYIAFRMCLLIYFS
jgi:glycosyltransferase involved in cell wall biosynthesis